MHMLPKTEVPLFLAANHHDGVLADWPLSGYTERTRTSEGAMSAGTTELHQIIHSGNLFVALCAGDEIRIFCRSSPEAARFLTERGYEFRPLPAPPYTAEEAEGCYFTLPVLDQAKKASELMGLRDHGVPFSEGKEWNPCEVFEYLRDLGLAEGNGPIATAC